MWISEQGLRPRPIFNRFICTWSRFIFGWTPLGTIGIGDEFFSWWIGLWGGESDFSVGMLEDYGRRDVWSRRRWWWCYGCGIAGIDYLTIDRFAVMTHATILWVGEEEIGLVGFECWVPWEWVFETICAVVSKVEVASRWDLNVMHTMWLNRDEARRETHHVFGSPTEGCQSPHPEDVLARKLVDDTLLVRLLDAAGLKFPDDLTNCGGCVTSLDW